jgi:hypothetical protein
MSNEKVSSPAPIAETSQPSYPDENIRSRRTINRRSFLQKGAIAGAAVGAGLMAKGVPAFAQEANSSTLTKSDIALLRFAAAAELIEADLWQQYSELGGLTPGQLPVETVPFTPMNSYQAAFMNLDSDGPQYITSNALD